MRGFLFRTIQLFIALAVCLTAKAQIYAPFPSAAQGDTLLRISLLTAAPGAEIYQLEGHTGLRMQYDGNDVVANWGLFDFSAPNFVYRFVKGETDYMAGLWPFERFIMEYMAEGRRVTEQELNLTPEQARRLIGMVEQTVRPENRVYRYNYVLDNCATRPIAYIERAVGDSIHFSQPATQLSADESFRSVMRHFHSAYPWYQFGIDMALGSGIDYPITVRQTGFAPVVLEQIATHATIGDSLPLVKSTVVLYQGTPGGVVLPPTPWYLTPDAVFWTIAAIAIMACAIALRRKKPCKWLTAIWFASMGIAGSVISFLVFVSVHEATSPNWLILWLNPLCLIVPVSIWWSKAQQLVHYYMTANILLIILYIITWAFGSQSANSAFAPMLLTDIILTLTYLKLTRESYY